MIKTAGSKSYFVDFRCTMLHHVAPWILDHVGDLRKPWQLPTTRPGQLWAAGKQQTFWKTFQRVPTSSILFWFHVEKCRGEHESKMPWWDNMKTHEDLLFLTRSCGIKLYIRLCLFHILKRLLKFQLHIKQIIRKESLNLMFLIVGCFRFEVQTSQFSWQRNVCGNALSQLSVIKPSISTSHKMAMFREVNGTIPMAPDQRLETLMVTDATRKTALRL